MDKSIFYVVDLLNSEHADNQKEYNIDSAISFAKELITVETNTPDVDPSALCPFKIEDVDSENASVVLSHFNYYLTKKANTKHELWVLTKDDTEKKRIAMAIHEQLIGNPDYRDNNIIIGMDERRTVKVWFDEECEIIPDITIPEHINEDVAEEAIGAYMVMDRANPHDAKNNKEYTAEEVIAFANSFAKNDTNPNVPAEATNVDEAEWLLDYYNRTLYYQAEADLIITVQTTNMEVRETVLAGWIAQLQDNPDYYGSDNIIIDNSPQDGIYLISTAACAKLPKLVVPGTN